MTIKVFYSEKYLNQPFCTQSGSLKKKGIFQIAFYKGEMLDFIYEVPLSPSLGEMPKDLFHLFSSHKMEAFDRSVNLKRAISYYHGMKKFPLKEETPRKMRINTYGIGDWAHNLFQDIARLKCDGKNVVKLIEFSFETDHPWCVDFNASLNENQWKYFLAASNLRHCQWIEQPLPINKLTDRLASLSPIDLYADEEMSQLTPKQFLNSPYRGFMLKPVRHDFEHLIKWIEFSRHYQIPAMINSLVSDCVSISLCKFFNRYMTIEIEEFGSDPFFQGNIFDSEIYLINDGVLSINNNVMEYINMEYENVFTG